MKYFKSITRGPEKIYYFQVRELSTPPNELGALTFCVDDSEGVTDMAPNKWWWDGTRLHLADDLNTTDLKGDPLFVMTECSETEFILALSSLWR